MTIYECSHTHTHTRNSCLDIQRRSAPRHHTHTHVTLTLISRDDLHHVIIHHQSSSPLRKQIQTERWEDLKTHRHTFKLIIRKMSHNQGCKLRIMSITSQYVSSEDASLIIAINLHREKEYELLFTPQSVTKQSQCPETSAWLCCVEAHSRVCK